MSGEGCAHDIDSQDHPEVGAVPGASDYDDSLRLV